MHKKHLQSLQVLFGGDGGDLFAAEKAATLAAHHSVRPGVGFVSEGLEEAISEAVNPLLQRAIYSDEPIDIGETAKNAAYSFLVGGVLGGVMGGASGTETANAPALASTAAPETQTFGQDMNLDNGNTGAYNENNGGVANEQTDATGVVSVNHEGDRRNVYGQTFDVGGEGLSRALLSLSERNGRKAKAIRGKNGTNVIYTPAKVEEYSADVGVMVSYWKEHHIPYHVRKGEYLFERNGI